MLALNNHYKTTNASHNFLILTTEKKKLEAAKHVETLRTGMFCVTLEKSDRSVHSNQISF